LADTDYGGENYKGWMVALKVGVLSDTHIMDAKQGIDFLHMLAEHHFAGIEIILHAGDVVNPDVLMAFADRNVHVVRGNMDPAVQGIPNRKVIEVGGFRIGLIHGWGSPAALEERVLREFREDRLDCLVFGHSHHPLCRRRDGILLFNPGSPTDRRWAPFHSVGILEIGANIEGRILRLED
jgi:putative phosphoesterase